MTDQRELDLLLGAFFVNGTDELADRVIDAALDEIDHTRQRHALRLPRTFQTMPMFTRLAAAAVIGVVAVGGALFLLQPRQPGIGGPTTTPAASSSSAPAPTETPVPTETPASTPDIPGLSGPLGAGRQIHTSSVLTDGRVLVAGGLDNKDTPLASAVLYDPGTDTFSPTGSLATGRGMHTATVLADGRVLIAGGGRTNWVGTAIAGGSVTPYDGAYLASAELYDPQTGAFSPTGSLTTTREDHTATLLADGRVLIAGGHDFGWDAVASAELYDPTTGTFSPTGSMAVARAYHTATLLADGRVLIAGGDPAAWGSAGPVMASAELYNPKTGTFKLIATLTEGRGYHAATLLADGRVLLTGGTGTGGADLATAEIYSPKTGTFSQTVSMGVGRTYHTATRLADGRVLVAGGGGDYNNRRFLSAAEIFDPNAGTFSPTGSMGDTRTYHGASLLADGRVLVTGGYGAVAPLANAELFDPTTGTWSPAGR